MKKYSERQPEQTIGLDLGDRFSYYVVLDESGEKIQEGRVRTLRAALSRQFSDWSSSRVVLEVGTHSRWVAEVLSDLDHEVFVANARRLRLITSSDRKSDRTDAELLARLGRVDVQLLSPVHHRSSGAQGDLQWLRTRGRLVKVRSELIVHVRGTVKSWGGRVGAFSAVSFARKAGAQIPELLRSVLGPVLDAIEFLSSQIACYDSRIEELSQVQYPETGRVGQIRGVGPVTALTYVLTLEEGGRFCSSRQVGAYLGLCPRRDQSGDRDPQLGITKAGDRVLRSLLVNCAHYILGPFGEDCDLRRHGEKIAARGGKNAKKRAVVAVARKLSVLMHRLWMSGDVYEPLYNAKRRAAA